VSLLAGFSAPIASALKSFIAYAAHFVPALADDPKLFGWISVSDIIAIALCWILILIHTARVRGGLGFNDLITLFKVCGIVGIILSAAAFGSGTAGNLTTVSASFHELSWSGRGAAFGTSLIFVMFCYSGWNASAYMAGEMKDAQRVLPRSLLFGTGLVVLLYLGMNAVYLYGADVDTLAGKVEVGQVAAEALFGGVGVTLVTIVLCVSIFASASAMTIVGPRVYYAFGKDFEPLRFLARVNKKTGAPTPALLLQGVATSVIILLGRIDQIQQYAGFTLSLFASLAVSCVIVLRMRRPNMERPFKALGYPITPILFIAVSAGMMFWAFQGRPLESSLSFATVAAGGIIFYGLVRKQS
jgi:APA family basic amino acid/polyamine antiporter